MSEVIWKQIVRPWEFCRRLIIQIDVCIDVIVLSIERTVSPDFLGSLDIISLNY